MSDTVFVNIRKKLDKKDQPYLAGSNRKLDYGISIRRNNQGVSVLSCKFPDSDRFTEIGPMAVHSKTRDDGSVNKFQVVNGEGKAFFLMTNRRGYDENGQLKDVVKQDGSKIELSDGTFLKESEFLLTIKDETPYNPEA